MPLKTSIKWIHRAVTVILLVVVIGFIMLNSGNDERAADKLVSSQQLNDHTWLYVTGYTGGGATVAGSYRFYLAGKIDGDEAASLSRMVPFLVAGGSGANVSASGDTISVKYGGKVISFSNSVVYEYNGTTYQPHISFQATN